MSKKKVMALLLAVTMALGCSMTVFAEGEDEISGEQPATTNEGGTTGVGSSEGHLEKEVINMILPTIPEDSTPFKYTMDPERLIQETNGAKYADYTFPAKDSDTGVYFLVGEKEYANTSTALQAVNRSSCNVTLTVKVKATASEGGKDITLATDGDSLSTTAPELYLGLTVGKETKAVSTAEATVTKTIAGSSENFEITVDEDNNYVYQEGADATSWKAINISMTGKVNAKAIEADTTAPTVVVTWSYAKAAEGAAVSENDQVVYTVAPAVTACKLQTIVSGSGSDITTALTADKGVYIKVGSNFLTVDASKLTSVKLNDTALTITTKGNSSANNNAVYFKLPSETTLKAGDKFTIVLDGTTYSFSL